MNVEAIGLGKHEYKATIGLGKSADLDTFEYKDMIGLGKTKYDIAPDEHAGGAGVKWWPGSSFWSSESEESEDLRSPRKKAKDGMKRRKMNSSTKRKLQHMGGAALPSPSHMCCDLGILLMRSSWSPFRICGRVSLRAPFITIMGVKHDALRSSLVKRPYLELLQDAVMVSCVLETYGMGMIYMILPYGKRYIVKSEKRSPIWFGSGCPAPGGALFPGSTTPSKRDAVSGIRRKTSWQ